MWAVDFSMNELGAKQFFELTKTNEKRPLTILLDDEAISAPNIQTPIYKRGQITGNFSLQEVQDLVDKLNAGSLPARLGDQPISENTVGPTLGKDNLQAGLRAGVYGLILVAAFMLVYYWFAGGLADVALFLNLLLITGIMALMRATFTMPGIAGLILTIGMAVDANVLVNERIREEQQRGSSLRMAIKNGYGRALRTIMDANITTFITGLILYLVASEEVKGFALILMIGIVSSMFTALFVTRAIFDLCTESRMLKNNLRMLQLFKHPHVNWMGKRVMFYAFSGIMVIGGWTMFLSRDEHANSKYSIEFTGGTSVHVLLDAQRAQTLLTPEEQARGMVLREKVEAMVQDQGRKAENPALAAARVQRIGREVDDDRLEFEIVTTETNRIAVKLAGDPQIKVETIQTQIRDAARTMGDDRLEASQVTAGEQTGAWVLETPQTNRNQVRQALLIMQRELSPLKVANISSDDDIAQALLEPRLGAQVTRERLEEAIEKAMSEVHVARLDQPTVTAGDAGAFTVQAKGETASLRRIVDETLANLAPVQVIDMETQELVTKAIRDALEGCLDELESLEPRQIQAEPITQTLITQKPYLASCRGGLLLQARFQNEQIALKRLQERFQQARLSSTFQEYGDHEREVFAPGNATQNPEALLEGVELAVVADNVVYGASGDQEWSQFVNAETQRLDKALTWETSLPRVTQIDASVGDRAKNDALVAIVFSLLAIILYIWLRFGNVRFGLAAVAALVHDVSIAMGMVAASAWLATTTVGQALGIADFKIDLTMIAGILTVIGYSLNDTIVVFDRIRENRGKLAVLSADVINHSINQTLSRTVLTSLTTVMVLVVMYIWGGAGLRGFNYVLIIGVLVGTYSSIAIASPLLVGARTEAAPMAGPTTAPAKTRPAQV
jgi:SecD/SecF fusion protein